MPVRKEPLITGEYYHIYSRSIDKTKIFRHISDLKRMIELIRFYKLPPENMKYCLFSMLEPEIREKIISETIDQPGCVEIVAFCVLYTHLHLLLRQLVDGGISDFMRNILDSHSIHYNKSMERKGPLWEGRFKNVHINSDEQLLTTATYIHLNPVKHGMVELPEDWAYSSYSEYIDSSTAKERAKSIKYLDMTPRAYRDFVHGNIPRIKELAEAERLTKHSAPGAERSRCGTLPVRKCGAGR